MKKNAIFTVFGTGVMALAGLFGAQDGAQKEVKAPKALDHQTALNGISMASIQSSWLEVPITCKDRSFNADPAQIVGAVQSAAARSVYSAFSA